MGLFGGGGGVWINDLGGIGDRVGDIRVQPPLPPVFLAWWGQMMGKPDCISVVVLRFREPA